MQRSSAHTPLCMSLPRGMAGSVPYNMVQTKCRTIEPYNTDSPFPDTFDSI